MLGVALAQQVALRVVIRAARAAHGDRRLERAAIVPRRSTTGIGERPAPLPERPVA